MSWFEDTQFLAICVFVGIVVFVVLDQLFVRKRERRSWHKPWSRDAQTGRPKAAFPHGDRYADLSRPPDAADQLRIVMNAEFSVQPLLNRSERRLFRDLDRMVGERNPAWRVMAQVSLGEVLRSKDAEAFRCINAKRVDLLLMDGECQPRHAVEYQGRGQHQGTAAARDAVKKEALRRAGVGYHEVLADHTTPADLRRLVDRLVDAPPGPLDATPPVVTDASAQQPPA